MREKAFRVSCLQLGVSMATFWFRVRVVNKNYCRTQVATFQDAIRLRVLDSGVWGVLGLGFGIRVVGLGFRV